MLYVQTYAHFLCSLHSRCHILLYVFLSVLQVFVAGATGRLGARVLR